MSVRLLLLPGLGADERLFSRLGTLCVPVVTTRLPPPDANESFTAYALRIAAGLDLRPEDWIGGCSFGSLVAADIARRRPVAGLVLIGGGLSSSAVAAPIAWLGRLTRYIPCAALQALFAWPAACKLAFGRLDTDIAGTITAMALDTPAAMGCAGIRLLFSYYPAIPVLCPVHAIHGDRDRLMRAPPLPRCRKVAGAGHALALSHAREVTAFLNEVIGGTS